MRWMGGLVWKRDTGPLAGVSSFKVGHSLPIADAMATVSSCAQLTGERPRQAVGLTPGQESKCVAR